MKKTLLEFLAVALGGALGAMARFALSRLITSTNFPLGTLVINISGSLFLGWFLSAFANGAINENARLAIAVGFVGAYTTFSTYMYESDAMLQDGAWLRASLNIAGSVLLGLIAVRTGIILGRKA